MGSRIGNTEKFIYEVPSSVGNCRFEYYATSQGVKILLIDPNWGDGIDEIDDEDKILIIGWYHNGIIVDDRNLWQTYAVDSHRYDGQTTATFLEMFKSFL